ncbi:MAG: hypothetical protein JW795_18735 [Chitinivibrionales bacterium]|nr:hypothetical protein [Chitinivibrionales bacterium]
MYSPHGQIHAEIITPPAGFTLSRQISRITGLVDTDFVAAGDVGVAWQRLTSDCQYLGKHALSRHHSLYPV